MPEKSPQQTILELRDLVVAYFRQEAIEPLKDLGPYIGFGVAGALLFGFGVTFLGVGALRALQTETGTTFTKNWSWAPYAIVLVALMAIAALSWMARTRSARRIAKRSGNR
jgi:divalent metal cation (Fe/Co/Zn/Cd) transporter